MTLIANADAHCEWALPWVAVRFDLVLPAQQVNMPSTQPRWLVPNDNAWNSYKIFAYFWCELSGLHCARKSVVSGYEYTQAFDVVWCCFMGFCLSSSYYCSKVLTSYISCTKYFCLVSATNTIIIIAASGKLLSIGGATQHPPPY